MKRPPAWSLVGFWLRLLGVRQWIICPAFECDARRCVFLTEVEANRYCGWHHSAMVNELGLAHPVLPGGRFGERLRWWAAREVEALRATEGVVSLVRAGYAEAPLGAHGGIVSEGGR